MLLMEFSFIPFFFANQRDWIKKSKKKKFVWMKEEAKEIGAAVHNDK